MIAAIKRCKALLIGVLCVAGFMVAGRVVFGPSVYPAKRLDAASQEILQRALRIKLPKGRRFDHVTVIHGKDSALYASAMIADKDVQPFLQSTAFEARPLEKSQVQLHAPALPWWSFKPEQIQIALREVGGDTEIVIIKTGNSSRVFIESGGGKSGFPADLWPLFR